MTATDEPIPCPVCGSKADVSDEGNGTEPERFWVCCMNPSCFVEGTEAYATEAEAIEAWNTREQAALNRAAGNWAHADKLLRGLLEECERCPDTGCTRYIDEVVRPNMRSVGK